MTGGRTTGRRRHGHRQARCRSARASCRSRTEARFSSVFLRCSGQSGRLLRRGSLWEVTGAVSRSQSSRLLAVQPAALQPPDLLEASSRCCQWPHASPDGNQLVPQASAICTTREPWSCAPSNTRPPPGRPEWCPPAPVDAPRFHAPFPSQSRYASYLAGACATVPSQFSHPVRFSLAANHTPTGKSMEFGASRVHFSRERRPHTRSLHTDLPTTAHVSVFASLVLPESPRGRRGNTRARSAGAAAFRQCQTLRVLAFPAAPWRGVERWRRAWPCRAHSARAMPSPIPT